jgi:hypothetical protein
MRVHGKRSECILEIHFHVTLCIKAALYHTTQFPRLSPDLLYDIKQPHSLLLSCSLIHSSQHLPHSLRSSIANTMASGQYPARVRCPYDVNDGASDMQIRQSDASPTPHHRQAAPFKLLPSTAELAALLPPTPGGSNLPTQPTSTTNVDSLMFPSVPSHNNASDSDATQTYYRGGWAPTLGHSTNSTSTNHITNSRNGSSDQQSSAYSSSMSMPALPTPPTSNANTHTQHSSGPTLDQLRASLLGGDDSLPSSATAQWRAKSSDSEREWQSSSRYSNLNSSATPDSSTYDSPTHDPIFDFPSVPSTSTTTSTTTANEDSIDELFPSVPSNTPSYGEWDYIDSSSDEEEESDNDLALALGFPSVPTSMPDRPLSTPIGVELQVPSQVGKYSLDLDESAGDGERRCREVDALAHDYNLIRKDPRYREWLLKYDPSV